MTGVLQLHKEHAEFIERDLGQTEWVVRVEIQVVRTEQPGRGRLRQAKVGKGGREREGRGAHG